MSNVKKFLLKAMSITLLLIMVFASTAEAAYIRRNWNVRKTTVVTEPIVSKEKLENLMNYFSTVQYYDLTELKTDLKDLENSGQTISKSKILELIAKLPSGSDKTILQRLTRTTSIRTVLSKVLNKVTSLLGKIGNGNLLGGNSDLPTPEDVYIDSQTAVAFAGSDYAAKLHGNLYLNEESNKWVILVHPFMLKGKTIANKVGGFYYEKGYNVIAPDLRSFGDSEGKVSLGFLESLDIYDWLNEIQKYGPEKVFIHGISLGGATTNFVSGIDQFMENAPADIRMDKDFTPISELGVVGLIEDCGYTNMTDFAGEKMLLNMGIGLNKDNFYYYSDATNSLKYCELPIMIIHGTSDSTVDPENANTVQNTVKGEVTRWDVDGAVHAFVIVGGHKAEYKEHVQTFIEKY